MLRAFFLPAALFVCAQIVSCAADEHVRRKWDEYAGEAPYPNRRAPIALTAGQVGVISNSFSDTLTFVALPDLRVIAEVPVGRDPVDIDGPHHLAVDRATGTIFTALSYPPLETALGPHGGHGESARFGFLQKLALRDLSVLGEVRVGTNPGDVVISDDGARVVVTHFDRARAQVEPTLEGKRAELMLIDASTLTREAPEPKSTRVCVAPHGVSLSAGAGNSAYVACYGEDSLAIVDLTSPSLTAERIPLQGGSTQPGAPTLGPYSALPSPDGTTLAIGCLESREVRLFEVATRTYGSGSLPTPGAAFFAAWSADGKTLYVPTQSPDAIVSFDVATRAEIRRRVFDAQCIKPHEVIRSADGGRLYVVCEGDHVARGAIVAVDATTLEPAGRVEVGVYPDRLVTFEAP